MYNHVCIEWIFFLFFFSFKSVTFLMAKCCFKIYAYVDKIVMHSRTRGFFCFFRFFTDFFFIILIFFFVCRSLCGCGWVTDVILNWRHMTRYWNNEKKSCWISRNYLRQIHDISDRWQLFNWTLYRVGFLGGIFGVVAGLKLCWWRKML